LKNKASAKIIFYDFKKLAILNSKILENTLFLKINAISQRIAFLCDDAFRTLKQTNTKSLGCLHL